ncbi:uncharacterized protein LOC133725519 [Rosa rugosa]|uniref:uncharacterized protein LOC133725519 n=1 Tax=Rosa rugosa TaxID=74645 RepID=UPI002B407C8A|nr:uncharacterized protein LOC133725519 [Rosa rugosa]
MNRDQARGTSPRGGRGSGNRGQGRGNPRGGRHSQPYRYTHEWRPSERKDAPSQAEKQKEWRPSERKLEGMAIKQQPGAGIHGPSADDFSGNKEGSSTGEMGSPQDMLPCSASKHSEHKPVWSQENRKEWHPSERKDALSQAEKQKEWHPSERKDALSQAEKQKEWRPSERKLEGMAIKQQPGAGIHGPSANDFSGNKEGSSTGEMGSPQDMFPCSSSKHPEHKPVWSQENRKEWHPSERKDALSQAEKQKEWRPSERKDALSQAEKQKEWRPSERKLEGMAIKQQPGAGIHGPSANDFSGNKEGSSTGEMGSPQDMFPCSSSKHPEHKPVWSQENRKEWHPSERKDALSHAEKLKEGHNSTEFVEVNSKEVKRSVASDSGHIGDISSLSSLNLSHNLPKGVERMQIGDNFSKMTGGSDNHMQSKSEAKDKPFPIKSPISSFGHQKPELSEHKAVDSSFDLCPTKASGAVTLKTSLLVQNRERKNEIKRSMEQPIEIVLQSGMVLLKSYISTSDQIKIVKLCRDLGLGTGGFYKPGYRDGAKLNLMMMCLGKNWDPETSKYGDHRPHDGAKPPCIPVGFFQLVENAIKDSRSLIRKNSKASNFEDILPRMTPDICLVNFYSSAGRLGLHQDRDESEQSLREHLPVVSFSIGDAAEFLYGDQRDVELAKKITLESGDVLIFGGESRNIFHGVASIQPNTAPKTLLEETKLRPGRLNLTFRKY